LSMGYNVKRERPFTVGAPMGIYCLWPVFALAHHVIVQWAASLAGRVLPFRLYVLRGDDIVFADPEVAHWYLHLLGLLGCDLSLSKTLLSSRDGPGVAEFAKTLWSRGSDLSPLSVRCLVACRIVDPITAFPLVNRLVVLAQPKGGFSQLSLSSVLTLFVRSARVRRDLVRYLGLPWVKDSLLVTELLSRQPDTGAALASPRTLERVERRLEVDLASDLFAEISDLAPSILHRMVHDLPDFTSPLRDEVRASFPVFRILRRLREEVEVARVGSLWLSPAYRISKLLAILRSLQGLGKEPSMSRRSARLLMASSRSRSVYRYIGPHGRAQLYR
jgi:hypothetical protein